ncbi:MAG: glycosyltransferase family 4 protein, partial [bacterium]
VYLALSHIGKFFGCLFLKNPAVVYLVISQGLWGYMRDLGFLVPAVIFRKKIVIHLRGSEFDRFYAGLPRILRLVTRQLFKRISYVIVLGEKVKNVFKHLVKAEKIVTIPNGVNFKEFSSNGKLPLKQTAFERGVLYLSSLLERKGVLRLIDAIPLVLEKHWRTRFTIAGEWQHKREKERAIQSMTLHNLFGRVNLTGEVSGAAKNRLYREHDIFVFPPIEPEGMPWVILEAMSAGLPVITTDQGTIAEIVEDGKTGFIVDPAPAKIAEKICYLIEHPAIAKKMGECGRRRIEAHFSEEAYLKRMESVLLGAVNNKT